MRRHISGKICSQGITFDYVIISLIFQTLPICEPYLVHSVESWTHGHNCYVRNMELRLSVLRSNLPVDGQKRQSNAHSPILLEIGNQTMESLSLCKSLSFCAKVQQFVLFRWTSGQKLKVRIRNFPGTGIANSLLYAPPWPGLKETSSGLCINLRFITPPFTPPFGCNFWMTHKRHTMFQE